jgi:uncharacterized sporulation protein YeaH/YhbH (DUF444 family)
MAAKYETKEEMMVRMEQQKQAKRAELDALLAPLREQAAAKLQAEKQAKADKRQASEEAQGKEAAERFDREHKEPTQRAWLANGGTPAEFADAWPELRVNLLAEIARKASDRAKAITTQSYRGQF